MNGWRVSHIIYAKIDSGLRNTQPNIAAFFGINIVSKTAFNYVNQMKLN